MRVSIETVYRWVYREAGLGGQLFSDLCRSHKKRRRQRRYGTGRGLIPGRISINERPGLVATRQRFGNWEGDTVEGAKGSGHITTHVERNSRYLLAAMLYEKKNCIRLNFPEQDIVPGLIFVFCAAWHGMTWLSINGLLNLSVFCTERATSVVDSWDRGPTAESSTAIDH